MGGGGVEFGGFCEAGIKIELRSDCYFLVLVVLCLWLCCKKHNGICEFYLCYSIE